MAFSGILLIFCILWHLSSAQTCHGDYSCALSTCTSSACTQCYGYHSCTESYIQVSYTIQCHGSYSCYKATRIGQPSGSHYNVQCYGLYSCAQVADLYIQDGHLYCYGELSCYNTTIVINEDYVHCHGDHSCQGATITSRSYNYLYGYAAAKDAIFYTGDTSVVYQFYGKSSGDGATIWCGNGATCSIGCYEDACNNLILTCANGDGTCTFSIDCTYAEQSTNCPNGYLPVSQFSSLIDDLPNLDNVTMSTYENSVLPCYTPITSAINCDDYQECQGDTLNNQGNKAPICCTASYSCTNAYELSTAIDVNSSVISGVAHRCDSFYGCYSIDNGIFSGYGGNIYFGGYWSGYQVASVVGQYGKTDIFCNAYYACRYSYNLKNAANLYCGGVQSCEYSVISHLYGNIYVYGIHSLRYATVIDVIGNIYCGNYLACAYSTINSIDGDFYSVGRQAFYSAKLTNATNVICYGIDSCRLSSIRGISRVFALGTDALSDSIIVSELGGSTMTVTISGTNSGTHAIYCNTTDICKIACKSSNACERVELRCFGSCFVDCNEQQGIECPFFGFWTYYNSSQDSIEIGTTLTPETTLSADTSYECDLDDDGIVLSWDEFFQDASFITDETDISLTQGVNQITNTFEVTVSVTSKYLVAATHDAYSEYYDGVTENDLLGVTYVLDVNTFDATGRLLENANNCENRNSTSFVGKNFLNDYWDYTLYPGNSSKLGNDKYLEYGDQNIWDIQLVGGRCQNVRWTHTFSFSQLFGECTDSDGQPTYTMTETDDDITFETNFYLTLVSPDPLLLTACDNGDTDCGRYVTATLLSHILTVSFPKQQRTISDNNNVLVDLFTSNIIGAKFTEGDTSQFEIIVRTTVPVAIVLNVTTASILSPSEAYLISINNGVDFIDSVTIVEDVEGYVSDGCLIATTHRCWQEFSIIIEINNCPSNTGLIFNADYSFSADFNCRDTNGDGIVNATEEAACDEYLSVGGSSNPNTITLESSSLDYTESCDATAYEVDWDGSVTFYNDDSFANEENEFTGGETVFTRISIYDDVFNYDLFGMSIQECYVCVSNLNDSDNLGDITADGCLDTNYVDTSQVYNLDEDGLNFELIDSNTSDTFEDFSFTLPTFASSSVAVFYVDCIVELGLVGTSTTTSSSSTGQQQPQRRRLLRSQAKRNLLQNGFSGNAFENLVGYAFYENDNNNNNNNSNNNKSDQIDEQFWYVLTIGIILALLIVVILIAAFCVKNAKQSAQTNETTAVGIIQGSKLSVGATNTLQDVA